MSIHSVIILTVDLRVAIMVELTKALIIPLVTSVVTIFLVLMFWQIDTTINTGYSSAHVSTNFLANPEEILYVLLLGGIPTIILFVISFVFRTRRRKTKRELRKIELEMMG